MTSMDTSLALRVVIPPNRGDTPPPTPSPTLPGPPKQATYQHVGRKTGDVEMERQVEDRIRQLGLLDNKLIMEKQLAERLDASLESGDNIVGALKKCRRRSRVKDQITAFSGEVRNIIRQEVERDAEGNKLIYIVNVLMGRFTKDVIYEVKGREIVVNGCTPKGPKLTKEIRLELPRCVDVTQINVSYAAGVFKLRAPYRTRNSSLSSGRSESRLSLSSDASWTSESTGQGAENAAFDDES